MAKTRLIAPFRDFDGKVGVQASGVVNYTTNNGMKYARTLVVPANPKSAPQILVRGQQTAVTQNWRNVDDSQYSGWQSLGAKIARTNKFGEIRHLSAYQAFAAVNSFRLRRGVAQVLDPPPQVFPPAPIFFTAVLDDVSLAVNANFASSLPNTYRIQFRLTNGFTSQRRHARTNELRIPTGTQASSIFPTTTGTQTIGTWTTSDSDFLLFIVLNDFIGVEATVFSAGDCPGGLTFASQVQVLEP